MAFGKNITMTVTVGDEGNETLVGHIEHAGTLAQRNALVELHYTPQSSFLGGDENTWMGETDESGYTTSVVTTAEQLRSGIQGQAYSARVIYELDWDGSSSADEERALFLRNINLTADAGSDWGYTRPDKRVIIRPASGRSPIIGAALNDTGTSLRLNGCSYLHIEDVEFAQMLKFDNWVGEESCPAIAFLSGCTFRNNLKITAARVVHMENCDITGGVVGDGPNFFRMFNCNMYNSGENDAIGIRGYDVAKSTLWTANVWVSGCFIYDIEYDYSANHMDAFQYSRGGEYGVEIENTLTDGDHFRLSSVSGTFTGGETLTGSTSGATVGYVSYDSASNTYKLNGTVSGGPFVNGETVTGSSSGETGTIIATPTFSGYNQVFEFNIMVANRNASQGWFGDDGGDFSNSAIVHNNVMAVNAKQGISMFDPIDASIKATYRNMLIGGPKAQRTELFLDDTSSFAVGEVITGTGGASATISAIPTPRKVTIGAISGGDFNHNELVTGSIAGSSDVNQFDLWPWILGIHTDVASGAGSWTVHENLWLNGTGWEDDVSGIDYIASATLSSATAPTLITGNGTWGTDAVGNLNYVDPTGGFGSDTAGAWAAAVAFYKPIGGWGVNDDGPTDPDTWPSGIPRTLT